MKALRTDAALECPTLDAGLGARGVRLVTLPDGISEGELAAEVVDVDLLLTCYTPITARVIASAGRLRGIIKYGVGIDAIDIDAAQARGIPVVNVPDYAEETVAEGAFALMIALLKRLGPLRDEVRAQGWACPTARWLGSDVAGKTLGLVGFGRIGRSLARMAGAGFRMRVLAYDPYVEAPTMRRVGVEKCGALDDLLAGSDVVSLHAVLNAATRHLIGRKELARMRSSAILINVARGALVDEAALLEALVEGRVAGAGLDVFSQEPLRVAGHPLSPLLSLPNVLVTPHLAFYTEEAMRRLEEETLARCDECLAGRPLLVKSHDPRLRSQTVGVVFPEG